MNKKILLILSVIVFIAGILRLVSLNTNPPEMTWDEVAWGYNAYSLGIDGRDEFGRFLPVQYLESFGDYKPPVYAYLDIIPVKLFGLTPFAVRLPSALFGIATVLLTFFLTRQLFLKSKLKEWYGLASAGILAISPWHILLSRAAFEANVATFFIVAGILAFLVGIQQKKWYLLLSAVLLVIPFYTFNSPRVFLFLFLPVLALCFIKKLMANKLQAVLSGILFLVLLMPLVPFLLSPQAKLRYQEVNIFSDPKIVKTSNQEIANDNNSVIGKLINNRRVFYAIEFMRHYLDEFNPQFLFFTGDANPKFSIQTAGELFIWFIPFFYGGWFLLFKKREGHWWILPLWMAIGIIPAATARETPHALRTEVILPTIQIVIGYALVSFLLFVSQQKRKGKVLWMGVTILCLFIGLFEFIKFTHSYMTHYPAEYSEEWQYGYKQSIAYAKQNESQYDQINVSDTLGRPYIYYLFYQQIPPQQFRETATITRDVFGFVAVTKVGKYYFSDNLKGLPATGKHILYIDRPNAMPPTAKLLETFYALDNQPVLVAYTN